MSWFTLPMIITAVTGPGESQEPGTLSGFLTWMTITWMLWSFFTFFSGAVAENWIGKWTVWRCVHKGFWHHRWHLTHWAMMAAPWKYTKPKHEIMNIHDMLHVCALAMSLSVGWIGKGQIIDSNHGRDDQSAWEIQDVKMSRGSQVFSLHPVG